MSSPHHTLFIDNGAYEIRAILDNNKVLPPQPNIAFRLPSSSSSCSNNNNDSLLMTGIPSSNNSKNIAASLLQSSNDFSSSATINSTTNPKFAVGDEIYNIPFSVLCRCRGKRPLGLNSILIDAPLQARIWKHLIYKVAGLHSEMNVDLVVTIQPGTPKESAVLWYTLCFVFFRFKSVTFVSSGWIRYLGVMTSVFGPTTFLKNHQDHQDDDDASNIKNKNNNKNKNNSKKPATAEENQKSSSTPAPPIISFILDLGFSGMSSFAVVNHVPRRCGFVQEHLGLNHVSKFLGRLISFTQMDIVRGGTPELLIQKGIMEKCLRVISKENSLHEHLMKWEKVWLKNTHFEIPSFTSKNKIKDQPVLFQGSLRRRLRSRDVLILTAGGKKKTDYQTHGKDAEEEIEPDDLATLWYALPSNDDDSSIFSTNNNNNNNNSNNENKNNKRGKKNTAALMNDRSNLANVIFGTVVANRFGDEKKIAKEGDFESESDHDSEDDDDDDDNNDLDETILRLDHERFIASEILFNPRQIIGEAVAGRFVAAFGSNIGLSLIGALPSVTVGTTLGSNNIVDDGDDDIHHDQLANAGGCLESLRLTMKRFGPESILKNHNSSPFICVFGGGAKIPGCDVRLKKEFESTNSNFVFAKSDREDLQLLFRAVSSGALFDYEKSIFYLGNQVDDGAAAGGYLARCRVRRAEDVDAKLNAATTGPQRKSAHESGVDKIFSAMQNILV